LQVVYFYLGNTFCVNVYLRFAIAVT